MSVVLATVREALTKVKGLEESLQKVKKDAENTEQLKEVLKKTLGKWNTCLAVRLFHTTFVSLARRPRKPIYLD